METRTFNTEMAANWRANSTEATGFDPRKAVRGSGEGFWSQEARQARTRQHDENSIKKVSMESQGAAWTQRFGEPVGLVAGQEVVLNAHATK